MKIGFIGCGNMGGALMGSLIKKGICKKKEIYGTDRIPAAMERVQCEFGVRTSPDIATVVAACDFVFLSVKPQDVEKTMAAIKPAWSNSKVLISICAGVQIVTLAALLGPDAKIIRVMPNTPALVGMMAAGYALNANVNEREADVVGRILNAGGIAYRFPEDMLNAVTGLSGSGPAYVAYLIREFAKAGERVGLAPEVSYGLALQTFRGTSQMLLERKMTPNQLIKMVTSPKGTTYAGRQVLESSDVPEVLFKTVKAGTDRSVELGEAAAKAAMRPKL